LKNWLQAYSEYTADSEASPVFHLWGGLGALSAVTGRQVYMDMGKYSYLTNLYTVLVGPPGSKKTTAMMTARNLVRAVPGIHLGANVGTPEAILKKMAKIDDPLHQSLTTYALELGTFLGDGPAQRHMLDFLCDIYDGNPDFEKDTIGRGAESITLPWFAFQACTTPEWLQNSLTSHSVEGGFVSRTLWIYCDDRRLENPWPEPSARLSRLRELLIHDLTHISALQGSFSASQEAKDFYRRWYVDPIRFPSSVEARLGGYYDRKSLHVMKLAMLLSISENDTLCLEVRDFEAALALLADIEPDMHRAFVGVGRNEHSTDTERVLGQIRTGGANGTPYGKLLAANWHALNKAQLDNILEALRHMGRAKVKGSVWYV
jgi:hypothetical protein